MALVIQTNVSSLQAQKHLSLNNRTLTQSFNKLSSGYRVNSASDDAAGLAISESMKSQIRSYVVAQRNAADGVSMAQSAEGALNEIHGVLGRMRELAMQASNGSMASTDRDFISTEFRSLQTEIVRIQEAAKFNGKQLVNATAAAITFQVGLNDLPEDQLQVTFGGVDLATITATATSVSGAGATGALSALGIIDTAIATVSTARSKFGTAMNRLEVASSNIQTMRTNLSAANSRIRDVDVATETSKMSKTQVLTQAGVSILAQTNQLPQQVLGLIG